jgi:hypothetical protein
MQVNSCLLATLAAVIRARRPWPVPLARTGGLIALLIALAAAGRLLLLPQPHTAGYEWPLAEAYPGTRIIEIGGFVDDDWAYTPGLIFSDGSSIGVASAGMPNQRVRLVLRAADGTTRTLQDFTAGSAPQLAGFDVDGDLVFWLQQSAGEDGQGASGIWSANRRTGATHEVTGDVGDFMFFGSTYDLFPRDGRLYWTAAPSGDDPNRTDIRSVAESGGPVTVTTVDGAWQGLPDGWLVSALTGSDGGTQLWNPARGARTAVHIGPGEIVSCQVTWCRVIVPGGIGDGTHIDVMHPDGTGRHRIAAGQVTASLADVALLNRWLVFARTGQGVADDQQVFVYDLVAGRTVAIASAAGQIFGLDGVVWWSTGQGDNLAWHALDLHDLDGGTAA